MDIDVSDEPDGSLTSAESAKSIKAIDKTTVHRICSGQVVLTLATAVKELVENSIDAGATSVEVRLRDHGTSLLEVCDNGKGVEEENFEGLTLKHHTSKLRDFGDLVGVKTFGFRGEALSSLCALSNLSVVTRHTSQAVGTKLIYDYNGKLTSKTPLSRQVGTTVSLQNLFSTLPVRHKEFQRNIKKEFTKMVQVLYSYCLISTGVRIMCTNQTDKGKKTVVVSTDGRSTVKENISNVFGAKQVSSLLEFKQESASTDVLTEYGMPDLEISQDQCLFTIEGFISSCAHGQGRSATDRQFYFINSRPCDPAKVTKVVNEVYHYYNRHQSPFVVLNIHLKEGDVDINVTPDKRQILVNNEKIMLATIKTSMIKLYENIPSTYNMQNTSLNSPMNRSFNSSSQGSSQSPSVTSPSTNSSGGRISALTLKFGRKIGGSPMSESSGSPLSSPSAVGLKRSLSQSAANASPNNKQPKLESFFKNKSHPLSSSNGSIDSLECTPPPNNGDAQGSPFQCDSGIQRYDNSLETIMEGIEEINDDGDVSTDDREGLLKELQGTGTSRDSGDEGSREHVSLSEEKSRLPLSSEVDGGTVSDVNVTVGSGDQKDVEFAEEKSIGNNQCSTDSSVNGKQSSSENIISELPCSLASASCETERNGSVGNNSSGGGSEGKSDVKNILSRFSRPATAPSPSCKKAHNATNEFLSNLMARKSDKKKIIMEDRTVEQMKVDEIFVPNGDDDKNVSVDEGDVEIVSESELSPQKNKMKLVVCEDYNPEDYIAKRKSRSIKFSLESLKKKIAASEERKEKKIVMRKFRAKIAPGDNQSAEDELSKEISKDMFAKMEILGQFNLGFIIAKLGSDLFIVDQHATDEKYNFETLQQTCVLQNQRLIIPQLLELTAVNESILLDNIEIFKKNGFEFKVDEEKCVGRRVHLTSMPFSRGWEFGRDDIEELIFMLSDSPGVMCRPSRVRAMFASRACRKSIMIGTALTKSQMQKLVVHMGEIEQPWNCPHGRPTMRHLVNLDMICSASQSE